MITYISENLAGLGDSFQKVYNLLIFPHIFN